MNTPQNPRSLALVFVHGLISSPDAWHAMDALVQGDPSLSDVKTYRFGYHTSVLGRSLTRRTPTLDDVSDSLYTFLKYQVTESEVILATHSQGGLVALRLVARHLAGPLDSHCPIVRSIVMFACPNSGSDYAWEARRRYLRKHPQERSLRPLDPETAESIRKALIGVSTKTPPLDDLRVLAVAGASDGIVSSTSAKGFWPEVETVPGDHSSIIRPEFDSDPSFLILRHRVHDVAKSPIAPSPAGGAKSAEDAYWRELADEVANRLHFDGWDDAVGGLTRTSPGMSSQILSDLHEFAAWLLGRIYPPGHPEIMRALECVGSVLVDLLDTFNRHTEMVLPDAKNPWIRVPRWYKTGQWNPSYADEADAYTTHVNLLTDLTLELTRAVDWFCGTVRAEIDSSWRLAQGGFVLEGGPYMSGDTRYLRPLYTDEERAKKPSPYPGLQEFKTSVRFERDFFVTNPLAEGTADLAPASLQDVEHALISEQRSKIQREVAVYRAWWRSGGRDEMIAALRLGQDSGLISRSGLRSPIWETEVHLRLGLNESGMPTMQIEDHAGNVKYNYEWKAETPTLEAFRELDGAMLEIGEHLGPGLFSPAESIRTATEAIMFACEYRAQSLNPGSQYFNRIIEYVDGWYISEKRLFPREHPYYNIDAVRFDEQDWEAQVSNKGWEGIHSALQTARALLGPRA